jgi:hypothetical protein
MLDLVEGLVEFRPALFSHLCVFIARVIAMPRITGRPGRAQSQVAQT